MHPFGAFMNVCSRLATIAPRGSQRAFASGQILNPYATHYRQPFAFSTILYPLIHQVTLRLPCPTHRGARADGGAYHVPLSTGDSVATLPIWLGSIFSGAVL